MKGSTMTAHRGFQVGVDLDGVCVNYVDELRPYAADELGCDPDTLPAPVEYEFTDWGMTREQFLRAHERAINDGRAFRRAQPIPGAVDGLQRLSDAGVHLSIVTKRLLVTGQHRLVAHDTVDWLEDHEIPYWDLMILRRDKDGIDVDVLIDDAPSNVLAQIIGGGDAIVFDQPYNRDLPEEIDRAQDWSHAVDLLLQRRTDPPDATRRAAQQAAADAALT